MAAEFHPELRVAGRLLPRSFHISRTLGLHRFLERRRERAARGRAPVLSTGSASVRLHEPASAGARSPALLWIHGGGMVAGTAAGDDLLCRHYADELGIVVAAVNYRLAPEHPFPAPLEDCYEALTWLAGHPGVDLTRIAIGGASAGGGLTAGLALLARERAEIAPCLQLLTYPMLDDRTALRTDIDETRIRAWDNRANAFGWRAYLERTPGVVQVSELAAPARAADLSGLPPTWLGVGTLDLFHDEDVAYAQRLRTAGVPCQLEVVPGAFHAFDMVVPKAQVSQAFRRSQLAALARYLL